MHPPLQIQIAPHFNNQQQSSQSLNSLANSHSQQLSQSSQQQSPLQHSQQQQKMYYVDPLDELFQYQQSPSVNNSPLTSPCDGYFPPESPIYSPSYYQLHPPSMNHRRHSSHELFEQQKETRAASARNRRKQLSDSFEKLRMVLQPLCGHIQSRQQLLESAIQVIEEYQSLQQSHVKQNVQ
eukprot:NODE_271_length_12205_cov_0.703205.p7 type:complete len:181 gc:universal NODE_271_length_12205_cov_0.703205:4936-5478(+)